MGKGSLVVGHRDEPESPSELAGGEVDEQADLKGFEGFYTIYLRRGCFEKERKTERERVCVYVIPSRIRALLSALLEVFVGRIDEQRVRETLVGYTASRERRRAARRGSRMGEREARRGPRGRGPRGREPVSYTHLTLPTIRRV